MTHHANLNNAGLTPTDIDEVEALISPITLDDVVFWWDDTAGCWTVEERPETPGTRLLQCPSETGWEAP